MAITITHKNEVKAQIINGDAIQETLYVDKAQKDNGKLMFWSKLNVRRKTIFELKSDRLYEILIFPLNGEIDIVTGPSEKSTLVRKGDVMIVYSGSEEKIQIKLLTNDSFFMVKVNIREDLFVQDKAVEVCRAQDFPVIIEHARNTKKFFGENTPFDSFPNSMQISETELAYKVHKLKVKKAGSYYCLLLKGKIMVKEKELMAGDFCHAKGEEEIVFHVKEDSKLFIIESGK